MQKTALVEIHPSQFPAAVRAELIRSLTTRRVNHKFHYDSIKQTQKWLALHQAYSPSRTNSDCAAIYDQAFAAAGNTIKEGPIQVIGLGCGGGQKDTRLLKLLKARGGRLFYTAVDVSTAMVLVAREAASAAIADQHCRLLACDLSCAGDLPELLDASGWAGSRLITFFGMIPNFEPAGVLPLLKALVRPGDTLLFSANLAPGHDYESGIQRVLPLYDNELTRDWLMAFLYDLGVQSRDGNLNFLVEAPPAGSGLKRIAAYFTFTRPVQLRLEGQVFDFLPGERIRLFFSYRHTPAHVRNLLEPLGLHVRQEWIAPSEEEGVFLVTQ
jgi:L-histidine Nalpha-methyltransferase